MYEQAVLKGSRLILGGCETGRFSEIVQPEAGLVVQMENEVGGFGKLTVSGGSGRGVSVLWRTVNGRLEYSQQMAI